MDSVGAGSGGGIHPGAPIIWPTIKPTTTETTETTESSKQQTQSKQSQQSASSSAASSAASKTSTSSASQALSNVAAGASSATIARNLSTQDISAQLMSINLADTPENLDLASKMLEHGLELSSDNFNQLFGALKNQGSNQTLQSAAFAALVKGMATNPSAVKALESFFSGNNNMSSQLQQLQESMASTSQMLNGSQASLNSGIVSSLTALLTEFDQSIKKMQDKTSLVGNAVLSKEELAVIQKTISTGRVPNEQEQAILKNMMARNGALSNEDKSMLQGILSKEGGLSQDELMALQSLNEKASNGLNLSKGMLQDLNALKSFIRGIMHQIQNTQDPVEKERLLGVLKNLESKIDQVMNNLSGQAILSAMSKRSDNSLPDKYFYWMIPNPFTDEAKNIEILIKRDINKKGAPVNPERTQLILKIETEELGEIAVIVEITGKDIWYLFNTDSDDSRKYIAANSAMLREQMSVLDYKVQGFNTQIKKIEINKILSPTVDLDRMKRVSAEA
ncbi:MAG: hypothetical protein A2Y40_03480 [Candidatus Margulisbacteria bacterium GWF2_35_9]|nr:MAG: hypothetical protein A2Y40_03480 [Candidatus Margulisbacteria bacterium GWF2_35_9]